jgi:hypothetical protein
MPIIPPAKSQPSVPVKATEESPNGRYYFKIVVSPTPELERLLAAGYKIVKVEGPRRN